jgi:glycine cleavage system transcriptional repressor
VPHYAVTAFGADRPGIVAALTWALAEAGGNLEDVSSTSLRGRFAMMLVVEAPLPRNGLQARLSEGATALGVNVNVREVDEGSPERTPATHILSVYGPDRPGIVARISRILADQAVNITDLTCRKGEEEGKQIYWMRADVSVRRGTNTTTLEDELAAAGKDLRVEVNLEQLEHRGAAS